MFRVFCLQETNQYTKPKKTAPEKEEGRALSELENKPNQIVVTKKTDTGYVKKTVDYTEISHIQDKPFETELHLDDGEVFTIQEDYKALRKLIELAERR